MGRSLEGKALQNNEENPRQKALQENRKVNVWKRKPKKISVLTNMFQREVTSMEA